MIRPKTYAQSSSKQKTLEFAESSRVGFFSMHMAVGLAIACGFHVGLLLLFRIISLSSNEPVLLPFASVEIDLGEPASKKPILPAIFSFGREIGRLCRRFLICLDIKETSLFFRPEVFLDPDFSPWDAFPIVLLKNRSFLSETYCPIVLIRGGRLGELVLTLESRELVEAVLPKEGETKGSRFRFRVKLDGENGSFTNLGSGGILG